MTINQKSKALSKALFDVIQNSGLPLFVCELHVQILMNAIQNSMREEDAAQEKTEADKTEEPKQEENTKEQ
mgnify:CR=1 FL=1